MRRLGITLLLLLAIAGLWVSPALAQQPSDDEVNVVATKLNCPTCAGLNLNDCTTRTCEQWKAQIKDLLGEGYTEQEVLDWYVARYGQHVLQEPPTRGVGLWVWLLPIVAVAAGLAWVSLLLKKWSAQKQVVVLSTPGSATALDDDGGDREASANRPSNGPADEEYLRRVEQDLKNL